MKNKLRSWLRKFLGVDGQAQEIYNLQKVVDKLHVRLSYQETLMAHTRSLLNVGIDINDPRYGKSWCVVCVKTPDGKDDFVNYFEINFQDYKQLKEILKQFADMKRVAYDLPHPLRGLKPFQF